MPGAPADYPQNNPSVTGRTKQVISGQRFSKRKRMKKYGFAVANKPSMRHFVMAHIKRFKPESQIWMKNQHWAGKTTIP
jgi:hypothetical protein